MNRAAALIAPAALGLSALAACAASADDRVIAVVVVGVVAKHAS